MLMKRKRVRTTTVIDILLVNTVIRVGFHTIVIKWYILLDTETEKQTDVNYHRSLHLKPEKVSRV